MSSPIPKRSEERRRTNSTEPTRSAAGPLVAAPPPRDAWDARVRAWYEGAAVSGQTRYYEASDWQQLLLAGDLLDLFHAYGTVGVLDQFARMCSRLLLTEGDRRTAHVELVREVVDDAGQSASVRMRRTLGLVDAG